jgi:hypothetical protein
VNFIGLSSVFRIFCIAITSANSAIPMLCGCTLRRTVLYVNKFLPQISAAIAGSHDRAFPGWKRAVADDFPPQSGRRGFL